MAVSIVPFEEKHLQGAADLLAARHARDRMREPSLPDAFESPEAVLPFVEKQYGDGTSPGVIAMRDGEPTGFLLPNAVLPGPRTFQAHFLPPRTMYIPYQSHGLADGEDASLYRELYAALAGTWVHRGYYNHFINVPHEDAAAREAWDSIGFGRHVTFVTRDAAIPVEGAQPSDLEIHQAGEEDASVIAGLNELLWEHHALSPVFNPHLRESAASWRELSQELLSDPGNAHFVAYRDGQPVAMNTFMKDDFVSPMQIPERCVYLFQGIVDPAARGGGIGRALFGHAMRWAIEQQYRWCALHFYSANLSAASFWLGNGFRPVEHRLGRRVDERIAWAGA